jgi:hypothetical protein
MDDGRWCELYTTVDNWWINAVYISGFSSLYTVACMLMQNYSSNSHSLMVARELARILF